MSGDRRGRDTLIAPPVAKVGPPAHATGRADGARGFDVAEKRVEQSG